MPKYAEIENNVVVNIIIADEIFIEEFKPEAILCPEDIGVGDKYENNTFSRNVVVKNEPEVI